MAKIEKNSVKRTALCILITFAAFAVCTGLCFLLDYFKVKDLNFIIIYVLGILLTAVLTNGLVYSAALSVISVLGYNFFFTVPRFSLKIDDLMYLVTFFLMLFVGLGIGLVTEKMKKRMRQINDLNMEKMRLKNDMEKEEVKAMLLRSISHDLRTPLTTIKSGAQFIYDNPDISEEDRSEILSDIIEKTDWTVRLVENLLSLTRIDSENLTVRKRPEAVEEVVPQAVRTVRGQLGGRKIHYELPDELLLVPMDATLIMQVIGNILVNAVRYTTEENNIWIKVWNAGGHAVFRISNDGAPIAEKDLPHVFEKYYTTGDTAAGNNVGLGLAICKLIVTAHGGGITARSADGKVTFEFTLPMEEKNADSAD